ncbi:MAG: hypothetical protein V4717_02235 [Bacteroidota bacterium]
MSRHLPKLLWSLAFLLGLLYLVQGFSFKPKAPRMEAGTTEKGSDIKINSNLDIRNLSHHLLDFNR